MSHFVGMMLMTPVAAIVFNILGFPAETTALLGMVVPMFLMHRIGQSEQNNNAHHHNPI